MSTTTIKPMQTLKGVFAPPKMNHRRDFLRENKLNLRELQRVTSKKPTATQHLNNQGTFQFHPQQQQTQQNVNANRRSASQNRLPPLKHAARSTSENRISNAPSPMPPFKPTSQASTNQNNARCPSCKARTDALVSTSSSTGIALKKTESRDIEIQTDDINDEEFLYGALKKCVSTEQNFKVNTRLNLTETYEKQTFNDASARSRQSKSDTNLPPQSNRSDHDFYKNDCYTKQDNQPLESKNYNQYEHDANNDELNAPETLAASRSHDQLANSNGYSENYGDHLNIGNLAIDNQQQEIGPPSGRSRRTLCSINSQNGNIKKKKSTGGSVHKFGGRDDIRLPRYLEREKRDKEQQRLREEVCDPQCPPGHFVLSEKDRLSALAMAEKKFKTLIGELNRMPMTTETLRLRARKAEIEKELVVLESDIRIFSKQKVYVKQEDSEG